MKFTQMVTKTLRFDPPEAETASHRLMRRAVLTQQVAWAVDNDGEAYESKLGDDGFSYHGYRLHRDDPFREIIIAEWRKRI